ncbi:hypothetical protein SS1G_08670 [Sclerotinia sclerotiorum 1980 UF-70]|uniref:Uncharacterized protein n=1 Tax=Sclerotinia sclerotiorum (strain ATCC 18683 / 1980 / Ss-1) TaxID=665079 RepID=A7ETL4_SCLS1|nr:hypothetical protein SS1G_08670 [Sclerotinia sclerotiorum 1980 UF-70]EDN92806.1 hypothetical protein SS1G_08670 [Sclerotinia sclerotiorum 1980 UF-70]
MSNGGGAPATVESILDREHIFPSSNIEAG